MRAAFVASLALLLIAIPATASAKFSRSAAAATSVSTDTLAPPANLTITRDCSNPFRSTFTATWTPTVDTYATGYELTISKGGSSHTYDISGRTTTTYPTTAPWLVTVSFTIDAVYGDWSSTTVTESARCP